MPRPPGAPPPPNAPVTAPFQGLYLDRENFVVPPSGLSACNNVRIHKNRLTNANMGYTRYGGAATPVVGNGPITGGGVYIPSILTGDKLNIFATPTDIYRSASGLALAFITPHYDVGTASVNGTAVTGTGTAWATPVGTGFRNNLRAGDFMSFGTAGVVDPLATWFQVSSVNSDTSITLGTSAGVLGDAAYTGRQCFAGDTGNYRFSFEQFPNAGAPDNGDLVFMANGGGTLANGVDPIFKWKALDPFGSLLSSFSFSCTVLKRFNNLMTYGNLLGVSGANAQLRLSTSMANSDNGLPTSLTTGVAGQFVVGDGSNYLTRMGVLGNSLLLYMNGVTPGGTVVSASFVGFPTIFQFTTIIRGRGPLAGGLVVEFPDRHQFIAADGEYRYNGLFIQIMNEHIWRDVLERLDFVRISQCFNLVDPVQGDVIWVVPLVSDTAAGTYLGNMQTAYVEHYIEQANNYLFKPYTQRDALNWTDGFTFTTRGSGNIGTQAAPIVGDQAGFLSQIYAGDTQAGVGYASTATFGARVLAGERSRALVKRIYPAVDVGGTYNLNITLTMQDRITGPTTSTTTLGFPLSPEPVNRFVIPYRRGRVGAVTFSTPGPSQPWTLSGYDWDIVRGGLR